MMQLNSSYNFLQLYQRLSPEVKGHSLRVSLIMEMIVNELLKTNCRIPKRFGIETHDEIRRFARESGFYHDIGKIKVPAQLLSKQGDLTAPELEEIRRHTLYASEVLEPFVKDLSITEQPYFSAIIEVCTLHHERWDGTGYPYALSGEDIPFFARVCAVADSYDAMISKHLYSKAKSHPAVVDEIRRCSGTQFDPQATKAFLRVQSDIQVLLRQKEKEAK